MNWDCSISGTYYTYHELKTTFDSLRNRLDILEGKPKICKTCGQKINKVKPVVQSK